MAGVAGLIEAMESVSAVLTQRRGFVAQGPEQRPRWYTTTRDFYLVLAHLYRRLCIQEANHQSFDAALQTVAKVGIVLASMRCCAVAPLRSCALITCVESSNNVYRSSV